MNIVDGLPKLPPKYFFRVGDRVWGSRVCVTLRKKCCFGLFSRGIMHVWEDQDWVKIIDAMNLLIHRGFPHQDAGEFVGDFRGPE